MIDFRIQYGNREVKIKNLSELSFAEYNYIMNILANEKYSNIEQYQEILITLTDLTPEEILEIEDITKIDLNEVLSQQIASKTFKTRWKKHNLIDVNTISIGRFIDIEYFLTQDDIEDKIETITALMYIDKEFDQSSLDALKLEIKDNMKIGEALQILQIFTTFRNNLYENYSGLFQIISEDDDEDDEEEDDDDDIIIDPEDEEEFDKENDDEEDEDIQTNSWGLMEYVYHLSGDRFLDVESILEKNIYEILNYLTWQKEKTDEQKSRDKQNNRKY